MIALTLLLPFVLMAGLLLMDRVERPLRLAATGDDLETFLASAQPEEVETFVSQGYALALEHYWRRRRRVVRRA